MTAIQQCPLTQEDKNQATKPPVTIRVSLFFDGTLNNRTNTSLRESKQANADQLDSDSYQNDYSNVSKLEASLDPKLPGYDFSKKIYVEGIGTQDGKTDSLATGASMGMGDTGVKAKVGRGLDAVFDFVARTVAKDVPITYIHLDSFGFSRGAAAARHFIHKALRSSEDQLKPRLESAGYSVGSVKMRFVGLFDTVASLGAYHGNDTRDLNLDAVRHAEKVVQLAAAEEHRINFRLTNIKSAGGAGRQFFLPGVHSDVGGGYVDKAGESNIQLFDVDSMGWNSKDQNAAIQRERNWLVNQGWYRANELKATNFWNEVVGNRPSIRNTYSRIPLQLMARYARELELSFGSALNKKHFIPPDLAQVNAEIERYVAGSSASQPSHWFHKATPMLQGLRHDYLHFSAFYGSAAGANAPQWTSDDPINGERARVIQDG